MKWLLLFNILLASSMGCHQVQQPEQAATIIDLTMPSPNGLCIYCAGYRIQVGSEYYYANTLPAGYDKPNIPVWIRYQADTDQCKGIAGRIQVLSIRGR